MNIYAILKAIVESMESEEMKHAKAEISRIREKLITLQNERRQLECKSPSPEQLLQKTFLLLQKDIPLEIEHQKIIQ